jgi:hypothetical protein
MICLSKYTSIIYVISFPKYTSIIIIWYIYYLNKLQELLKYLILKYKQNW